MGECGVAAEFNRKALDFRGGSGSSLIEPGDFQAHNGCHDVHRITRARHSRRGPRAKRPSAHAAPSALLPAQSGPLTRLGGPRGQLSDRRVRGGAGYRCARASPHPRANPIGFWWTLLCGVGGSLLGGLVGRTLFHFGFVTLVLEVLVAAAFVVLVGRRQRGHDTRRT